MKEFWIVCGWNNYYPWADIGNIIAVCFSYEQATEIMEKHKQGGYPRDYYEVCHSSELPWVLE